MGTPKKLSTVDEQCLKVMSNKDLMQVVDLQKGSVAAHQAVITQTVIWASDLDVLMDDYASEEFEHIYSIVVTLYTLNSPLLLVTKANFPAFYMTQCLYFPPCVIHFLLFLLLTFFSILRSLT